MTQASVPDGAAAGVRADDAARRRGFIVALLALFTAGAAVSMRAVTAVHMQSEFLDPIDPAHAGEMLGTVLGAAFASFALTLLLVSPVLAAIGFRRAFLAAAAFLALGFAMMAGAGGFGHVYAALLAGMVVQGIGWGLVETTINPLASALYPRQRVAHLSTLHAWYPAGLVVGSLIGLAVDGAGLAWRWTIAPVALFALVFAVMAARGSFPPVSASTDAPVGPREMIAATLKNPTIFFWVVLMMFTASTEFAPGQWVDVALSQIVGMRGILLLAYVSGLMFVMRHFAGPLVRRLGNVGLLMFSAVLATIGLFALGAADSPLTALVAATAWGFGVCYFWPTMLATVAERYPRSGTVVFGLMGSAGAASTYVVLPYLGAVYDKVRLAAAGGDPAVLASAQGEQLRYILTEAAAASFRTVALIPLVLIFVFAAVALADRLRARTDKTAN
jgi:MFS family permease